MRARSRCSVRQADRYWARSLLSCGSPIAPEVAVEKDITVLEQMNARARPPRLAQVVDRPERNAGLPRPDDHRRDKHMQPVDGIRIDEARNCAGAAFDEEPLEATVKERRHNHFRIDRPGAGSKPDDLDACGGPFLAGPDHNAPRAIVREALRARGQPPPGIDDDARRMRAGNPA